MQLNFANTGPGIHSLSSLKTKLFFTKCMVLTLRKTGIGGAEAECSGAAGGFALFTGAFGRGLYDDDVRNSGGEEEEDRLGSGELGDVARGLT